MSAIKEFGYINGEKVYAYILENEHLSVEILSLGGIIKSLITRDKFGEKKDVVLGFENVEDYFKDDCYLGAVIGRVCNRIEDAKFTLNGIQYNLYKNDKENSLHGGKIGFNRKIFDGKFEDDSLVLTTLSLDGEEGYPGNLYFTVKYSLDGKKLKIEYLAKCDKDTPINITNHTYFNLDGSSSILNTKVFIDANQITPVNENLIAKGFMDIKETPFDFNEFTAIGKRIDSDDKLLKICGGYDVNFVLNNSGDNVVAMALSEKSGIKLSVYTTEKGMQFYTGNFLKKQKGKYGETYNKRDGFCFETQGFPNAINREEYPSIVLKQGDLYKSTTIYEFGIENNKE